MKTDDIRNAYLQFFVDRGAARVASDSLVPANDPTLLFTGAGMNQFKDQFMGLRVTYTRATSSQKCIRTGDIMNVGVTPGHHTLFEMLGNFSFGDYFKKEAIAWAWEFVTGALKLPENRLQVSVHRQDGEAHAHWRRDIGLPESSIHRLGDHDNFWPADAPKLGPNGPCGPCSEIFYDRGAEHGCGRASCGIACDCRRWIEIWNLVFTQYDRQADGRLDPLPQRNIDTGMGLERIAAVMQGKARNLEIDIFQPLLAALSERSGHIYGADNALDVPMRRIADHVRAIAFCVSDGVTPSNTHRGYVLKRLLRRAVLDGRTLGIDGAFLHDLAPVVGRAMRSPYPEILDRAEMIAAAIRAEEEKFLATLERGLMLIDMAVKDARAEGRRELPGQAAFELYDTYGFPYELAEEVVAGQGLGLDRAGFDAAMAAARAKAREGAKMKGDVFAKGPLQEVKKIARATDFTGYDALEGKAAVLAIVANDVLQARATAGDAVTVVLDRTPFYGESGGQVGDAGMIIGDGNLVVRVEDTQKLDGIHLHIGTVESGTLSTGIAVAARVDADRRRDIERNHTATHLLHRALREVLGDKVEQRGSLVTPERLRFDFSHPRALAIDERRRVEEIVNRRLLENGGVTASEMPIDEARAIGATALFGEKYGDVVRVVRAGTDSVELCGGTHIAHTALAGSFRILSEESVAAGIRRIEAATGRAAFRRAWEGGETLAAVARELNVKSEDAPSRVRALLEEAKALAKQVAGLRGEAARAKLAGVQPVEVGGAKLAVADLGAVAAKELASAASALRERLGDGVVAVLTGVDGAKASLAVAVGPTLVKGGLKAGDLVKRLAPIIGGGGGGRPEFAQAGGKDPSKTSELIAAAPGVLAEMFEINGSAV